MGSRWDILASHLEEKQDRWLGILQAPGAGQTSYRCLHYPHFTDKQTEAQRHSPARANNCSKNTAVPMLHECIQSFKDSHKPHNSMTTSSSFYSFESSIPTICRVLPHSFTAQKIKDSALMSPSSLTLSDALRPDESLPAQGIRTVLYLCQLL